MWVNLLNKQLEKITELEKTFLKSEFEGQVDELTMITPSKVEVCTKCSLKFTVLRRREQCKKCKRMFCKKCASNKILLLNISNSPVRICDECYNKIYKL
ncbi:arrestin domain-containing protein d [Anaeramoeba flamelloides]|uniref:Arrestin domain-containing protein d n=1 Tax=Anaeramoeba flamelloides TaxID=1746091 RepID=A0ABQ8YCP7_9EUKA|nr:arrestin domain-containing protein d [Anaeramoeba flamelloides]